MIIGSQWGAGMSLLLFLNIKVYAGNCLILFPLIVRKVTSLIKNVKTEYSQRGNKHRSS
jgi:hypothetical protein